MCRLLCASLLLALLFISTLTGQERLKEEPKKTPVASKEPTATAKVPGEDAEPGEVEIHFLNGSKVRLTIMSDKLEIVSIYGKLAVPMQDVQSIEFGLHFPEGAQAKIDLAVKNLNNGDYRERQKAAKALIDLGPYSYAAVLKASKAKETEVAARAKEIVQKLQEKHPKKDLRTNTDDRVVTATQTLVGRILTPTVKTKAAYFGEVEHKLANMRTLRAFAAPGQEVNVAIDATKYANAGQWMETGYQVDGQSVLVVTAKGQVDTWPQGPGQYMCGPSGVANGRGGFNPGGFQVQGGGKVRIGGPINTQMYGGALLGKIGEDGEPFLLGDRYEGKPEAEGKLYLHIGPSPWNCQSTGTYEVKIGRKND